MRHTGGRRSVSARGLCTVLGAFPKRPTEGAGNTHRCFRSHLRHILLHFDFPCSNSSGLISALLTLSPKAADDIITSSMLALTSSTVLKTVSVWM